jgi:hypothetical protein
METKEQRERKRKAIDELNSKVIKDEVKWLLWMTFAGCFSLIMFLVFAPSLGRWIDSWPWYYQAGISITSFLLVFLWIKKQNR